MCEFRSKWKLTKNMQPIRLLLVDDHKILRGGLRALIESEDDMIVVAEAGTARDGIRQATESQPDIVIMDLGLPDGSGLDAIRKIRHLDLPVHIIVLSMHSGQELVLEAVQAGCDGYVPKSTAHTDLLQAIRSVYQGKRYLHPDAATVVIDKLLEQQTNSQMLENLSEREQAVLRLCAMGYTSREIGERLSLSPKTVDTYRARAMEKLDLEHRSQIVQFALKAGLLDKTDS